MDQADAPSLHRIVAEAESDLTEITRMLQVIRDQVAPMISQRDLSRICDRHSVRARIAPHPCLRRASFAAEAARASLRRLRGCVDAALTMLDGQGAPLDSGLRLAEARHWTDLAIEQRLIVARARDSVEEEEERALTGTATIADLRSSVAVACQVT